ncbi:MAG TPA: phage tail protein [Dongiaceae bacterium]|jgi:phage tail-like protein
MARRTKARRTTTRRGAEKSKRATAGNRPSEDSAPATLPFIPRNFSVAIDGVEIGFNAISALASASVEEPARGRPKMNHRYANIVLRRALCGDRRLHAWREAIMAGKTDRRRVEIRQLDDNGDATMTTWILEGAWPCRWSGPAFDANASEIAMEEIELAFARLIWR